MFKKAVITMLMITLLINGLAINVKAMNDISNNLDYWKPSNAVSSTSFNNKVNLIASTVRTIGIIISVITLSIIGIKFMLGSVEEKAQYKQTMIPWLIGAILVFAMTNVPMIIYNLTQGTFN